MNKKKGKNCCRQTPHHARYINTLQSLQCCILPSRPRLHRSITHIHKSINKIDSSRRKIISSIFIWGEERSETRKNKNLAGKERHMSHSWQCRRCTFLHHFPAERCSMCDALRISPQEMRDFISGKQHKRREKMKRSHDHSDDLQLSGHLLKLIVQCLEPRDVLSCIPTCRQWRNEIDEEVWIAVAKNISPMAVSAIKATVGGRPAQLDYRRIAFSLARTYDTITPKLSFPAPRLRLEDVLVVLEVRDKESKEPLGAWSGALMGMSETAGENEPPKAKKIFYGFELNENSLKLAGFRHMFTSKANVSNEMEREMSILNPALHAPPCVYKNVEMRSSLIRLDAGNKMYGKCICLNDFMEVTSFIDNELAYFLCSDLRPCARNESGSMARDLCFQRRYNFLSADLDIGIKPVFQDSNQSAWLKRAAGGEPRSNWIDEFKTDADEQFRYSFNSFRFKFTVCIGADDCPSGTFKCKDDMLLVFEGLNWQ